MVLPERWPYLIEEHGFERSSGIGEKFGSTGNIYTDLMVTPQGTADGAGDAEQEASHTAEIEAVQVDEDTPVASVKVTVKLVENGGFPGSPLSV